MLGLRAVYRNDPIGHGETLPNGEGQFLYAVLQPKISVHEGADFEFTDEINRNVRVFMDIS